MGRAGKAVIATIAVLIIGGVVFAVMSNTVHSPGSKTPTPTPSPSPTATANPSSNSSSSSPDTPTIIFDGNMFSPGTLTVNSGNQITFVNRSSNQFSPDSDPHPQHTSNPELNVGLIEPGQSKTITVTKTGTFSLHNHLNPGQTARITIE